MYWRILPTLLLSSSAFASTAKHPEQHSSLIFTMLLFMGCFYFMIIRPQQKSSRDQEQMLAELKVGDEVIFSEGILGKIHKINDHFLTIKTQQNQFLLVEKSAVKRTLIRGTFGQAQKTANKTLASKG